MTDFVLNDFLPYQLDVAAGRISRDFASVYRDRLGVSIAEWRVLAHLSQEDAVSVREVFARVDLDKSRVSRAAARLEDRGFITKAQNASDRRLVALALTDKGHELMAEITPLAREFEAEIMAQLGKDADGFRAALRVLVEGAKGDET